MNDMLKMVVVLTILSAFSGGLLAAVRNSTKDKIELNELQMVKGPAIMAILAGCSNDPVADRFKLQVDEQERTFFVGAFDGKPTTVVFEVIGKGYGDDIGLAVAIDMEDDTYTGVGVTTHKETPGLGALAKEDPAFAAQFKGKPVAETIAVSQDGGDISALSGATVTSRAVCAAATEAGKIYNQLKPQLAEQLQQFTQ